MTDIYDRATEKEEQHREQALKHQRDKAALGDTRYWRDISAKWCATPVCGERIPDARRKAIPGVKLCRECQEKIEKYGRVV